MLLELGQDLVAVAAEYGGHPGRRARRRLGHPATALAHEHHRLLGGDHPRPGRRGDLPDAVARHGADAPERVGRVREQRQRRQHPGGHQQRLGDGGVTDGVGVGLGAVVGEVEAGHRGEPVEPVGERVVLQPRTEESRGLRPLARCDDD
jgi:hypothetical protein